MLKNRTLSNGSLLFNGTNGTLCDGDGDPIVCRTNSQHYWQKSFNEINDNHKDLREKKKVKNGISLLDKNKKIRHYHGIEVQRKAIFNAVKQLGGYHYVNDTRKWSVVRKILSLPESTSGGNQMKSIYQKYFDISNVSSNQIKQKKEIKADRRSLPKKINIDSLSKDDNNQLRFFKGIAIQKDSLFNAVSQLGGYIHVDSTRKWSAVRRILSLPEHTSAGNRLKSIYQYYFNLNFISTNISIKKKGKEAKREKVVKKEKEKKIMNKIIASKCDKSLLSYKGITIAPMDINEAVFQLGGYTFVDNKRKWSAVRKLLNLPQSSSGGARMKNIYQRYEEQGLFA